MLAPRRISELAIAVDERPLVLPPAEADRVAAHWSTIKQRHPEVFDGPILLVRDVALERGRLAATAVRTSYAVLMALVEGQLPHAGLANVFGGAAVVSADGAVFLGRMGAHCYEPGVLKWISGTPDFADIDAAGRLDLIGSIRRELTEETGLTAQEARADPGFLVLRDGPLLSVVQTLRFPDSTAALEARIDGYLRSLARPELAEVVAIEALDAPALADSPGYVVTMLRAVGQSRPMKPVGPTG